MNETNPPKGAPIGASMTDLLGDEFVVVGDPKYREDSEGNGMWTQDVQGPIGLVRQSVESIAVTFR